VREIVHVEWNENRGRPGDLRIQPSALGALQEAAEAALVTEFQCKISIPKQ